MYKIDFLQINTDVCRICLDNNIMFNWDEEIFEFCGISYKDCYYKYTQLDASDSDCLPRSLCEICADDLKNAHFLFEKALESFNVLQAALSNKKFNSKNFSQQIYNGQQSPKSHITTCNEILSISSSDAIGSKDEVTEIEYLSYASDIESTADLENTVPYSEEILVTEEITIEPMNFTDIQDIELSHENVLEEQPDIRCHNELDRKSQKQHMKSCKNDSERNYESESSIKQYLNESCDVKYPVLPSTNQTVKKKKKYIFICQYCSLEVNGTTQLKRHEATHSDNRKRTETCPHCGLKLYTKLSLTEHIKIHDQNRKRKNKCEFCDKAFFNKGGLNIHRRIHLGQMMICRICSKEFYRQIDLDKHLLKHSVSPKEKNVGKTRYTVQCQYCNKYVLTLKWKEHKAAHLNEPQVKCKLCDKNFFSRTKCVRHLQRLHRKGKSEYENFIHYFVDHKGARISHLKLKQEGKVQPLLE